MGFEKDKFLATLLRIQNRLVRSRELINNGDVYHLEWVLNYAEDVSYLINEIYQSLTEDDDDILAN